jgi:hypothetical protein
MEANVKLYAVDFWINPNEGDDPDRSDYSNDQQELEALAETQINGNAYKLAILYRRKAAEARPSPWTALRRWPPK